MISELFLLLEHNSHDRVGATPERLQYLLHARDTTYPRTIPIFETIKCRLALGTEDASGFTSEDLKGQ